MKRPAALPGALPGQPAERLTTLTGSLRDRSRRWVLLFGAGLSAGAGLPDWKRLTDDAAAEFGYSSPRGVDPSLYPRVLQQCEGLAARPADFWGFITRKLCQGGDPTPSQELLSTLPFELFVSLNYDRLLEEVWKKTHIPPPPRVMRYPHIEPAHLNSGRLLYLHGKCPGANRSLNRKATVLTERSYDVAYDDGSQLLRALEYIFASYDVLMVGTSMNDPDMSGLLQLMGHHYRMRHLATTGTRRRWFLLRATLERGYRENMDVTFGGSRAGIEPIWYHNPSHGNHEKLERLIQSIASEVNAP